MVAGLERFRDHFKGLEGSYVLIGGTACEAWMNDRALDFRATKDLDIVLVIEALDPEFVDRFKDFVAQGQYQQRTRQETGRREFFRFSNPQDKSYPDTLELFARAPSGLDLGPEQTIVPVEEGIASLSAILLEDEYYQLVRETRVDTKGVPMASADGLIPLKARAYLDLVERREAGGRVDQKDIKKHRNDVFRLALTLPQEPGPELPEAIVEDLRSFLEALTEDHPDWKSIQQALKGTVPVLPEPSRLRSTLAIYFGVPSP